MGLGFAGLPESEQPVAKGTDAYIVDSEVALKREPLPKDDPSITLRDRALINALEAIAQAILALVKKR